MMSERINISNGDIKAIQVFESVGGLHILQEAKVGWQDRIVISKIGAEQLSDLLQVFIKYGMLPKIKCTTCQGTGGKGHMEDVIRIIDDPCPDCGGDGKRQVYTAEEIAKMKCPYPPEEGYDEEPDKPETQPCTRCGGDGYYLSPTPIGGRTFDRVPCRACRGSGKVRKTPDKPKCEKCNDTGVYSSSDFVGDEAGCTNSFCDCTIGREMEKEYCSQPGGVEDQPKEVRLHPDTRWRAKPEDKSKEPECARCGDRKEVLVRCPVSQSFTGRKWVPCPDCGGDTEKPTCTICKITGYLTYLEQRIDDVTNDVHCNASVKYVDKLKERLVELERYTEMLDKDAGEAEKRLEKLATLEYPGLTGAMDLPEKSFVRKVVVALANLDLGAGKHDGMINTLKKWVDELKKRPQIVSTYEVVSFDALSRDIDILKEQVVGLQARLWREAKCKTCGDERKVMRATGTGNIVIEPCPDCGKEEDNKPKPVTPATPLIRLITDGIDPEEMSKCKTCQGTGGKSHMKGNTKILDDPCPDCGGSGIK